jgi:hypothetical protein
MSMVATDLEIGSIPSSVFEMDSGQTMDMGDMMEDLEQLSEYEGLY